MIKKIAKVGWIALTKASFTVFLPHCIIVRVSCQEVEETRKEETCPRYHYHTSTNWH